MYPPDAGFSTILWASKSLDEAFSGDLHERLSSFQYHKTSIQPNFIRFLIKQVRYIK